jgi:hypothetical protein
VSTSLPSYVHGLVDDAAIFPPGNAPLDEAVAAHRRHEQASYADMVGPFVVADNRLPELGGTPGVHAAAPLDVIVVVTGGAGAIEPAVTWASRTDGVELAGLEIAMRESDAGDLAPNARRIVTAFDQLGVDVPLSVEVPRLYGAGPPASWLAALDELAAMDHRLKLRTGGLDEDAFPSVHELATCIVAALDRELRFKCTAGLHRAVRHRDPETGFDHHGFLNVLLATRASLDGAGVDDLAGVLAVRDGAMLTTRLGEVDADGLTSARRWFTSFGSCSILEPLDDLKELGLVTG